MRAVGFLKYAAAMVALCAAGCASTGGTSAAGAASSAPTQEELQAKLHASVEEEVASARKSQGAARNAIIYKRPYYYKEYFEFPGGEPVYSLDFTEKESRTVPLTAELEVEKVRYATRFKTERDAVQGDENYLRSHGINYISYELRNGEWRRVGDLFLADSTQENIGGEWTQINEEKRPAALVETESKGWFERLKFWK